MFLQIIKLRLGLERKIHDKYVIIDQAVTSPHQITNIHLFYKGHFKMGQNGKTSNNKNLASL